MWTIEGGMGTFLQFLQRYCALIRWSGSCGMAAGVACTLKPTMVGSPRSRPSLNTGASAAVACIAERADKMVSKQQAGSRQAG